VRVGEKRYSVPSRLIGHTVEARQHPDVVEIRYADKLVETMPRIRGQRLARIDYRHVIWSLVRKPGAFAAYRYREELFPSLVFRRAYDALCAQPGCRADIEYVRILHLAASTMESQVEATLTVVLDSEEPFDYVRIRDRVAPPRTNVPTVSIPKPDLAVYDRILTTAVGA
jgi:hypothetical protein